MNNPFKFLKIVLTDFKRAGMLAPTSVYAVKKIILEIPARAKTVIEYGPGNGVVTKRILKILPKDGKLIAIEINPKFVEYLKKINDPRLEVIQGDILEAGARFPKADAIVSGIPFTFFTPEKKESIIQLSAQTLKENGVFIPYQHSLILLKVLKKFFGQTKWKVELRNFPTFMFIMTAGKPQIDKNNDSRKS